MTFGGAAIDVKPNAAVIDDEMYGAAHGRVARVSDREDVARGSVQRCPHCGRVAGEVKNMAAAGAFAGVDRTHQYGAPAHALRGGALFDQSRQCEVAAETDDKRRVRCCECGIGPFREGAEAVQERRFDCIFQIVLRTRGRVHADEEYEGKKDCAKR